MSIATVAAVVGAGTAIYGTVQQSKAANAQQRALNQAAANSTTDLGAFQFTGPGGSTANVDSAGTGSIQLGGTDSNIYSFLSSLGLQTAGGLGSAGNLSSNITNALNGVRGAPGAAGVFNADQFLSQFQDATGGAFKDAGDALSNLQRVGFQRDLASTAFRGAGQQLGYALQDPSAVRDQTLANLRAQAAPFESRALNGLNTNLFATGRLGTTGGSLQTEAFARGLGQADLSRQLAANEEGRAYQQNALGLASGALQQGTGITGLEDSLLNSVFGRFQNTANLGMGVTGQRFQNSLALNQLNFDRLNSRLGTEITAAQLPTQFQGNQLNLLSQLLGQRTAIEQNGMAQFQAALAAAQAGANARIGSGSNVAALTGLAAQLPTSQDIWGNALVGAGSRLMQNGAPDWLKNIFSKTPTSTTATTQPVSGTPG